MREHFICSRMKKPLPFVLGGKSGSCGCYYGAAVFRRALLKINFIFVELRWMNIYRGEVIQRSLNLR